MSTNQPMSDNYNFLLIQLFGIIVICYQRITSEMFLRVRAFFLQFCNNKHIKEISNLKKLIKLRGGQMAYWS